MDEPARTAPAPGSQTAKRPAPMRDGPLRHRRRLTRGVSAARSVQRIATGLLGALGGADGQLDALTNGGVDVLPVLQRLGQHRDRKSTRLNSSHAAISYSFSCMNKKTQGKITID